MLWCSSIDIDFEERVFSKRRLIKGTYTVRARSRIPRTLYKSRIAKEI